MIIDARKDGPAIDSATGKPIVRGVAGLLINLDTGWPIRKPYWADLDTGHYEAFRVDADGNIVRDRDGKPLRYHGQANLKWIPATPVKKQVAQQPVAAKPVRAVPVMPLADRPCEHKTCIRMATWKTIEEEEMPPLVVEGGKKFDQARFLRARYWCEQHYQLPVLVHQDGSRSRIEVDVRP